ncbi:MAG: hypothetical protein AAFO69_21760, partial [Bacteroidota bacterium]
MRAQQACNLNAGPDQTLCFEMDVFNLQGIVPASVDPASVSWTQDLANSTAPLTINNPNDPSTGISPGGVPNFAPGTYTFVLEGRCLVDNSVRTDVVVINIMPAVTQAQVFDAGGTLINANPLVVCRDVTMFGQAPAAGENGAWTFTGVQANQFNFTANGTQVD